MSYAPAIIAVVTAFTIGAAAYYHDDPKTNKHVTGTTKNGLTEWEHGFETSRVIATRYKSPMFGYKIGFRFLNTHDDSKADTDQVSEFFSKQDCGIIMGGGAPFSEYFVICKGVTDKESANVKLRMLLPALDKFMGTL